MNPKIFVSVLVVLSLSAGVAYAVAGNWRLAIYWFGATAVIAAVGY